MALGLSVAAITLTSALAMAQAVNIVETAAELGCNKSTEVKPKAPKSMQFGTQLWVSDGCKTGSARCVAAAPVHKKDGGKRSVSRTCEELPK